MSNDIAPNPRRVELLSEIDARLDGFQLELASVGVPDSEARRFRVEYQFKTLTAGFDDYELGESSPLLDSLMQAARTDAEVEHLSKVWGIRSHSIADLHRRYDAVVWDAVWKTLRDDAGQLPFYKDEVAKDLHSACWLKITEQLGKYKDTGKLSGWVWEVAQNVVFDWKRREARRWTIAPMEQLREAVVNGPRARDSRLRTPSRVGIQLKRSALCPECGDVEPKRILSGTKTGLTLSCGHNRPRGL